MGWACATGASDRLRLDGQEGRFMICLFWLASTVMHLAVYSALRCRWWPVWSGSSGCR